MTGRVVVVGSVNVDFVVHADRLPLPGETLLGGRFSVHDGGKGANQAVAAMRAGAEVTLIAAVGADDHGTRALSALSAEGVDVSHVRRVDGEHTGVASIVVGSRGENQIVVAPGANAQLTLAETDLEAIASASVLLTGLEVTMPTATAALRAAHEAGIGSILNPAPAHALPADILAMGPVLVPNEHELVVAIGNDDTGGALDELAARHAGPVVVTQGAAGALLAHRDARERFEGFRPRQVVDTTGAGDTFCGVLAAALAIGRDLRSSIVEANAAAALSVTAAGARAGMPTRAAIDAFLGAG